MSVTVHVVSAWLMLTIEPAGPILLGCHTWDALLIVQMGLSVGTDYIPPPTAKLAHVAKVKMFFLGNER